MRDPLLKWIASSPLPCSTWRTWAATLGRFAMPSNWSNVSRAVVLRCAVQITVRPGFRRHSAKMMQAIRYVLPTCRGMLMQVVSAA